MSQAATGMNVDANTMLLAKLPIDPELSRLCDCGQVESYERNMCGSLAEAFAQVMPVSAD